MQTLKLRADPRLEALTQSSVGAFARRYDPRVLRNRVSLPIVEIAQAFDAFHEDYELREIAHIFGFKGKFATRGSNKHVLIGEHYVIKFDRQYRTLDSIQRHQKDVLPEYQYILKMRADPIYWKHFPETFVISDRVVIQERCDTDRKKYDRYQSEIGWLARALHIGDIFEGNIGFRGHTPVFIDCEFNNDW